MSNPNYGGRRPGAGRKSKHEEKEAVEFSREALISKFGSMSHAFKSLLESGEPTLIRYVFDHAFGKPKEKVNVTGSVDLFGVDTIIIETKP